MDAVKQQMNKPIVVGIIGLVIGTIFGLVVLGWWIFPVEWTDASPADLSFDWQTKYLRPVIEAYGLTADVEFAQARYEALGEDALLVYQAVAADPVKVDPNLITQFGLSVVNQAPTTPESGTPAATAAVTETSNDNLRTILIAVCLGGLLAAAIVFVIVLLRSRRGAAPAPDVDNTPMTQISPDQASSIDQGYTDTGGAPLTQFMASYAFGSEIFDDSFSIESPSSEFLGECGVGISETIGVGDPRRITAFEVWLFDKNDIQTVTKVLMSSNAFNDGAARQRLAARGEPTLVSPGDTVTLETQTLKMVAQVLDMEYGEGALPAESFFSRFVLNLSVWQKA